MVTAYCMVLWGRKAVCRPPPSTYAAPRSQQPWEAQEDAHRGTGVGSIFRFVNDLEWQPAWGPSPQSAWWRRAFRFRATLTRLTPAHKISPQAHSHADPNRARQARPDPSDPRNFPSFLIERPTDPPTNQLSKQVKPPWQSPPTPTHTNQLTTTQARLGRRALRADGRSRPILLPDSSAEISGAEGRVYRGSQRWATGSGGAHSLTHSLRDSLKI
jgi:hypothetical protein